MDIIDLNEQYDEDENAVDELERNFNRGFRWNMRKLLFVYDGNVARMNCDSQFGEQDLTIDTACFVLVSIFVAQKKQVNDFLFFVFEDKIKEIVVLITNSFIYFQ